MMAARWMPDTATLFTVFIELNRNVYDDWVYRGLPFPGGMMLSRLEPPQSSAAGAAVLVQLAHEPLH